MVAFSTTILQFAEKGEKTGWSYISIPADIAGQLKPGNKKSFRVKGRLDAYSFQGVSLLPMGGGDFIMPLNATVRRHIRKAKGAQVQVQLETDERPVERPAWMEECLADEPVAQDTFNKLPGSHQKYFIKWIETAKSEATKTKRIAMAVTALSRGLGFSGMMQLYKKGEW